MIRKADPDPILYPEAPEGYRFRTMFWPYEGTGYSLMSVELQKKGLFRWKTVILDEFAANMYTPEADLQKRIWDGAEQLLEELATI